MRRLACASLIFAACAFTSAAGAADTEQIAKLTEEHGYWT